MVAKITVRSRDLERKMQEALAREANPKVARNTEALYREIKATTPVDTGFAQSRWRLVRVASFFGKLARYRLENDASYINQLNLGSSRKAPARFIEQVSARYGRLVGQVVRYLPFGTDQ